TSVALPRHAQAVTEVLSPRLALRRVESLHAFLGTLLLRRRCLSWSFACPLICLPFLFSLCFSNSPLGLCPLMLRGFQGTLSHRQPRVHCHALPPCRSQGSLEIGIFYAVPLEVLKGSKASIDFCGLLRRLSHGSLRGLARLVGLLCAFNECAHWGAGRF